MSDKEKLSVFLALKLGTPIEKIMEDERINEKTLLVLHKEFDTIEQHLQQLHSVDEISKQLKLKPDYIEKVRHIIETDPEKLQEEIEEPNPIPDNGEQDQSDQPIEEEIKDENKSPKKKDKKAGKGGKDKNVNEKMESSGEGEIAELLIKDVSDIAKSMAIDRQELGKHAMECYSTAASQFGYTDLMQFMDYIFNFWIENQGKISEMQETIEVYEELIDQLKGVVDMNIAQVFVESSIERVLTASLLGGATRIDFETLEAYRQFLMSDPNTINKLKKLIGQHNNANAQPNTLLSMM